MEIKYNDPIITKKRKGTDEDPYVSLEESHTVERDTVVLTELPSRFTKVVVTDSDDNHLYEVFDKIPEEDEFLVDYNSSIITLNQANDHKQYKFKYKGTGLQYIPDTMVYTRIEGGKIKETLNDLTEGISDQNAEIQDSLEELAHSETIREGNENRRKNQEDERISNEAIRQDDEEDRLTNEDTRKDGESKREENEGVRESNEVERKDNEYDRDTAESERNDAENERVDNESNRKSNESSRESSESARQDGEDARESNEGDRQTNTSKAISDAMEATDKANNSSDRAEDEADRAKEESSDLKQLKSDVADATTDAQNATENAEDKANYASEYGDYAKEQGDYAKEQGDIVEDVIDGKLVVSINGESGKVSITPESISAIENISGVNGIQAGAISDRPSHGKKGLVYIATDDNRIYRDTGDKWEMIGGSETIDWKNVENVDEVSNTKDGILSSDDYKQLKNAESTDNKGKEDGYAELDSNAKLPLSSLPDMAKSQTFIVEEGTSKDDLKNVIKGDRAYEVDSGDSFIWNGSEWLVLAKADWENVKLNWSNIKNKPSSNISEIDDAVNKKHEHSNGSILDDVDSSDGELSFKGKKVVGEVDENLRNHKEDDAPHSYGGVYEFRYNEENNALDLVVLND